MSLAKFQTATLEDIVANPQAYGAPTFEQFCKNPDKYRLDWAKIADDGASDPNFKKHLKKTYYKVLGYKAETIEKAETIAKDHGLRLSSMRIAPQVEPLGGGWFNLAIEFMPPEGMIVRKEERG
jgi:hypothetical protein